MTQREQQFANDFVDALSEGQRTAINAVRNVILDNLPDGYEETVQYGMPTHVIPLATYPVAYNKMPLAFARLASQKNYMTV